MLLTTIFGEELLCLHPCVKFLKKDPILVPIGMFENRYLPNIGEPMLDGYCTIDEHKYSTILRMMIYHHISIVFILFIILYLYCMCAFECR